jgi:hypothetical protein
MIQKYFRPIIINSFNKMLLIIVFFNINFNFDNLNSQFRKKICEKNSFLIFEKKKHIVT